MKKLLPAALWLGMSLLALLAVFVFVLQLQSRSGLNRELNAKKEKLRDAQTDSREMENLESKSQELKQKENKMRKLVVVGDTQPLVLIKTITGSANKIGLRKISFELKAGSVNASKDENPLLKAGSVNDSKDNNPLSSSAGSGPAPVFFQMKFDASFTQLLKFLQELNSLERIVTVEKIEIKRKTEILPSQSVVLDLITYSFTE